MKTVTEVVSHFYPFDFQSFEKWCLLNGHDAKAFMEESAQVGESAHKACLSGEQPCTAKDKAYLSLFTDFCGEKNLRVEQSEGKCFYIDGADVLFLGRYDALMLNHDSGKKYVVEIKTHGAWRGDDECKPLSKLSLDKAHLQTSLYSECIKTETGDEYTPALLHLHLAGITFIPFEGKHPRTGKAIEWAKENLLNF